MKKNRPENPVEAEDRRALTLTKDALESARQLGLSPAETAAILGVAPGTLAAMKQGKRAVDGLSGEAERADAMVRVTRRLNVLLGEANTNWRSWLRRSNDDFDSPPLDILLQRDGVLKVARYLERAQSL